MKKNLVYRDGVVDRTKFRQSLWHEKFEPCFVSEMEELRHAAVLRHKRVVLEKWRGFVKLSSASKIFWGTYKRFIKGEYRRGAKITKDRYEIERVVFKVDEGISHSYASENDSSAIDFVRCLSGKDLPKYLNSKSEKVRETVVRRMKGDTSLSQYEQRQDLVDLYYRCDTMFGRVRQVIGYYDLILIHHYQNMKRRILQKPMYYEEPRVTLVLNDRLYIFEGGKLAHTPEHSNYVFFEGDLGKGDQVPENFGDLYRDSVKRRSPL